MNQRRPFRVPNIGQTRRMRCIWKWIGLAGVAGVVAGGALVARDQRRRNSYTPDDIRARLHQRLAEAGEANT
jgi:hypothetical protein